MNLCFRKKLCGFIQSVIIVSFEVKLLPFAGLRAVQSYRVFWLNLVLYLLNDLKRWVCATVLRAFWQHATIRFSIPTGGQIIACPGGWTWTVIWLQSRSPTFQCILWSFPFVGWNRGNKWRKKIFVKMKWPSLYYKSMMIKIEDEKCCVKQDRLSFASSSRWQ